MSFKIKRRNSDDVKTLTHRSRVGIEEPTLRKIRIGVAGCGASVWMHGPALARQEDAEVVAWMDPSYDAAAKAAAEYGGEIGTDYAEMVRCDSLDAVIVASPPWAHAEQVALAAEAGKHVLCEKPMARYISECRQIIHACKEADVLLMAAFMKRFDPAYIGLLGPKTVMPCADRLMDLVEKFWFPLGRRKSHRIVSAGSEEGKWRSELAKSY